MNDQQRLTQMKREYDNLKVELGIAINEHKKLKAELWENYKVKTIKEVDKLLEKLGAELNDLESKRDTQFDFIEAQLAKYRR